MNLLYFTIEKGNFIRTFVLPVLQLIVVLGLVPFPSTSILASVNVCQTSQIHMISFLAVNMTLHWKQPQQFFLNIFFIIMYITLSAFFNTGLSTGDITKMVDVEGSTL